MLFLIKVDFSLNIVIVVVVIYKNILPCFHDRLFDNWEASNGYIYTDRKYISR